MALVYCEIRNNHQTMLDLKPIRVFLAVADRKSFTAAARDLGLAAASVTRIVAQLEQDLGTQLLVRTTRQVGLTSAGEQLLSYGRKLLVLNDEIYSRMTDDAYEGVLILGVPHDIVYPGIPRVLKLFKAEHPRMRLQLLSSATIRLKEMFANATSGRKLKS